jgi:hypothetical protein
MLKQLAMPLFYYTCFLLAALELCAVFVPPLQLQFLQNPSLHRTSDNTQQLSAEGDGCNSFPTSATQTAAMLTEQTSNSSSSSGSWLAQSNGSSLLPQSSSYQ